MGNGQRHPRQATEPSAFGISLSKGNGRPLFVQLHEQIIDRISAGELTAGARLPPVRRLAEQLGINHMTVAKAYKDLAKAGFVEGRAGGGTHVRAPYGTKRARGTQPAVAGEGFYASNVNPRTLRVSFGFVRDDALEEGVARLCSVAKDLMPPRSAPSPIFT